MRVEARRVWKVFMAEDHNHDGALTYKEFQSTLRKFNIEMSAERFNEVVLDFDKDGDRSIPYRELLYSLQGEETKIMLDHLNGTHLPSDTTVWHETRSYRCRCRYHCRCRRH